MSGFNLHIKCDDLVKIASFDLDWTLLKPKGNNIFSKDKNDFEFIPSIEKFRQLLDKNYKIVIFTNQMGIKKGKASIEDLKYKFYTLCEYYNCKDIILYMSIEDDHTRKPRLGMWELLVRNNYSNINMAESFYCGDACGRSINIFGKKDFSTSDIKFAINLNIKFITPEELFFNNTNYLAPNKEQLIKLDKLDIIFNQTIQGNINFNFSDKQEVIFMHGPPASGKSTFIKKYLISKFVVINCDELKTISKIKKSIILNLNEGNSIVVDSTSNKIKYRAELLKIIPSNILVNLIKINISKEIAMHNNMYRSLYIGKKIPSIAIHAAFKQNEVPTLLEGFANIYDYNFTNTSNDIRYNQFLV